MTRSRGAGRRRRLAVLLTVLVVAACGGGKSQDPPDDIATNPRDPVRAMLRQRAQRLMAGDVEGYLRPVKPEVREFESRIAEGALAVGLTEVDLTIGTADVDPTGTRFDDAEIAFRYRYKDLPADNPFTFELLYDLERQQDGSWIVADAEFLEHEQPAPAGDDDDEGPSEDEADRRENAVLEGAPLWATGPVQVTRSDHFLVLSRPTTPRVAEAVANAEEGRRAVDDRLTLELDPRQLLVLAADEEELRSLGFTDSAVAVSAVRLLRCPASAPSKEIPVGRFIAADVSATFGRPGEPVPHESGRLLPDVVFQHELGHHALARFDRTATPAWVAEGGAMLLAGERRTDGWRELVEEERLHGEVIEELDRYSSLGPLEYAYANAAVSYLVEEFGAAKFWDFYQNYKEFISCERVTAEIRAEGTQRLLRRYYDITRKDLSTSTNEWIREQLSRAG